MTREEIKEKVLANKSKALLLELATGVGKTYLAIEKLKQLNPKNVLVIVPKRVLVDNWKAEFKKFGAEDVLAKTTIICYPSVKKYIGKWDAVVLDEAHNITPAVILESRKNVVENYIYLSATLPREKSEYLKHLSKDHGGMDRIKVSISDAIDSEILPQPKFIHHKLDLRDYNHVECIYHKKMKSSNKDVKTIDYVDYPRFVSKRNRNMPDLKIRCNPTQYLEILEDSIEYAKNRYEAYGTVTYKNIWMSLCRQRLVFFASLKTQYGQSLIEKGKRCIIFCGDIKQATAFSKHHIVSKDKSSVENLKKFNNEEIDILSSCNILNEGVNITNCPMAIFLKIDGSQVKFVQKIGRSLRHKEPEIHLVYFKGTREEVLINKMLEENV